MKPIEPIKERFRQVFGGDPAVISAAPGRVEFIGNHTDYNLGPVIGAAIDRRIYVAIRRVEERLFRFASGSHSDFVSLDETDSPVDGRDSWVNYLLGVYNNLIRKGLSAERRFRIIRRFGFANRCWTVQQRSLGVGLRKSLVRVLWPRDRA